MVASKLNIKNARAPPRTVRGVHSFSREKKLLADQLETNGFFVPKRNQVALRQEKTERFYLVGAYEGVFFPRKSKRSIRKTLGAVLP